MAVVVMYRCMRSTLCSGDRHTRETNKVTKVTEDTKSGFYTVQSLMSLWHDDSHAITSRQQGNLRLTHFQCSQFAWSRNQGRVASIHAADSVTFAERMQEIPSPDHSKRYTGVVNTVLRYSNVLHLHQHVCHDIGDTMVRTSRFTLNLSSLVMVKHNHIFLPSI